MALNLMCASGADVSDATATASNVLAGKTFYAGADDDIKTGSMVDNGTWSKTLSPGDSVTVPGGYHSGSGTVKADTVTLSGTAGAAQVLSGYTFYKDNYATKLIGIIKNNGAKTATLSPGGSYTIPAGYHNGAGKITASRWTGSYYLFIAIQFQSGYANGYIPEHAAFALAYNGTTEPSIYNKTLMAGNIAGQSNICGVGMLSMTTEWGNYQYANCSALANIYDLVTNVKYPKGTVIHLAAGWHVFRTY